MILRAYLFSVIPCQALKSLASDEQKKSNPSKSPMIGVFYTTRVTSVCEGGKILTKGYS
jgi:hypothetical protein